MPKIVDEIAALPGQESELPARREPVFDLLIRFFSMATVRLSKCESGTKLMLFSYVEGLFEYPNRQFVRKEQSDFGWDWGMT